MDTPPPPMDTPPPAAETPENLAMTGFVQSADGWYILLENLETQEGRLVRPGNEEFGYLIKNLDVASSQLVLEKDGQEVRLRLGENKKGTPPARTPPQGGGPGGGRPPNQPGGSSGGAGNSGGADNPWMQRMRERFGGNIPPEMMQRWEEWQRRRGG